MINHHRAKTLVSEILDRLKTALADRYAIQGEVGAVSAAVKLPRMTLK